MKTIRDNINMVTGMVKILPFYFFTFLPLSAQTDSLLLRDYQFVKQSDPWLTQRNSAALMRFKAKNIAEAELSLNYGGGRLTEYYDSPDMLQGGAAIESFYRINQRTVVFGGISYDNWTGHDMTGSAFINPSRYPFDIVEDSLTNPGRKHRDTYQLSGAFSYTVAKALAVGIRLDYTSANYAKYKDLRHKNKLMDLQLTAGVYAPVLPWLSVGADYTYHRQTESVDFGTYGKSDKVYKSLIDYGASMGMVEQFGNEGYTDKSREMPLFEDSHGGAFQLELSPLQKLSIYGSLTASHATGYYGRKSPYTITYTNHDRDIIAVHSRLTYAPLQCASRFSLDASYSQEKLQNKASTFRGLTNANGATYYEYYDPVETADKKWREADIRYTMYLGIQEELPTWILTADYHWLKRDITAYLFPYYRQQRLTSREISASLTRNMASQHGVWSISVNGGFRKGSGEPYEDGTFVAPSSKQTAPATMPPFVYRDYHLLTAAQYCMGLQLKYAFLFPGTRLKPHFRAAFQHRKANEQSNGFCGRDYTIGTLAIGCLF